MEQGASIVWDDGETPEIEELSQDLHQPVGTITKSGSIILASRYECRVYRSNGRKIEFTSAFAGRAAQPIAVMDTEMGNVFAVLDSNGALSMFREGKGSA